MKNKILCTIADRNFRSRVLALNDSLSKYNQDYTLYLLNLDNQKIVAPNIVNIPMLELLANNDKLRLNQNIKPSKEAIRLSSSQQEAINTEFTWAMSACFTNYCFNKYAEEDLLYIDADIYFYDNWRNIYENIRENDSIGLVEHRMPWTGDSGKYNVGIMYFKKNKDSQDCLNFWEDCVLFDNEYKETHGTCGDQKYLELFPEKFKNVISLDNYIGHLAPWNLVYHQYIDGQIIWNNKKQKLLYYHFSNFKPNFKENSYVPAPRHHIHSVNSIPFLKSAHDQYYKALKIYE